MAHRVSIQHLDVQGVLPDVDALSGETRGDDPRLLLAQWLADEHGLVRTQTRQETRDVYWLSVGPAGAHGMTPSRREMLAMHGDSKRIVFEGALMKDLTDNLAFRLGAPVIDATGLQGRFDFVAGRGSEELKQAMIDHVERELGLTLTRDRAEIDVTVIKVQE